MATYGPVIDLESQHAKSVSRSLGGSFNFLYFFIFYFLGGGGSKNWSVQTSNHKQGRYFFPVKKCRMILSLLRMNCFLALWCKSP